MSDDTSTQTPDFTRTDPDWRDAMHYLVPVRFMASQCTPCRQGQNRNYTVYEQTWITKHPWANRKKGQLITRCPDHQRQWEQENADREEWGWGLPRLDVPVEHAVEHELARFATSDGGAVVVHPEHVAAVHTVAGHTRIYVQGHVFDVDDDEAGVCEALGWCHD